MTFTIHWTVTQNLREGSARADIPVVVQVVLTCEGASAGKLILSLREFDALKAVLQRGVLSHGVTQVEFIECGPEGLEDL